MIGDSLSPVQVLVGSSRPCMGQAAITSFSSGLEPEKERQKHSVSRDDENPAQTCAPQSKAQKALWVVSVYVAPYLTSVRPWLPSCPFSLGLWRCCQPREKPAGLVCVIFFTVLKVGREGSVSGKEHIGEENPKMRSQA